MNEREAITQRNMEAKPRKWGNVIQQWTLWMCYDVRKVTMNEKKQKEYYCQYTSTALCRRQITIQGPCRILICKFKEYSRSIQGLFMDYNKHVRLCEWTGGPNYRKRDISWHIKSVLVRFSLNLLLDIFQNTFCVYVAVKEESSKHSQISRSFTNFQRKILILKEFYVPLTWHFKFQHFSRSSRTCISLGNKCRGALLLLHYENSTHLTLQLIHLLTWQRGAFYHPKIQNFVLIAQSIVSISML